MGNVASRADDDASLYLLDQNRFAISSLSISNPRRSSDVNIVPSNFPATGVNVSRSGGDSSPIEFVLDPEQPSNKPPNFLLKLTNDDELLFKFTFIIRQTPRLHSSPNAAIDTSLPLLDTRINALTYVHASSAKEVETLVTREFHADPNLHKNANVALVGDYGTDGSPSVSFEWTWKWKPPKHTEDRGGGWRNSCSFVEYDPHANRFHTLASFSYWVANPLISSSDPGSPLPPLFLASPPKPRAASSQTVDSRLSTAEEEPASPLIGVHDFGAAGGPPSGTAPNLSPPTIREPVRVDVACPRPADDMSVSDDGPVFRATIKALEQKTGTMRSQLKRVLKRAEQAHSAQVDANDSISAFIDALRDTSNTNANAVQPVIDHYFNKIAREILNYQRQNTANIQRIIIEPLHRLYVYDIKQADSKKRDFEEESKDYYSYVARYLGQRHDSVKTKKLAESDTKYQTKRRNFELKRFDYSSFMQDLHGGRKEQDVLSYLTKYADAQTWGFLEAAKKIEMLLPQFEALSGEVQEADKEYQYQRREREERRRLLETSNNVPYVETDPSVSNTSVPPPSSNGGYQSHSDTELGRADSTGSQWVGGAPGVSGPSGAVGAADLSRSPGSLGHGMGASPSQIAKFKGIRDLEERDYGQMSADRVGSQRKEGLLWALSRPGSHVDPRAQLKAGWHKFWIVLDQGKLSEYSNWKQKLDLHMDPIDLRLASVREARNAERRFCFEVITPNFKRVYQATSEEDMNSWILSINNALQSAVEGRGLKDKPEPVSSPKESGSLKRDIGSILTGKSPLHSSHHQMSSSVPSRRTTVASRPTYQRMVSSSYEEDPDKLLQMLRDNDQGNCWCADCGSGSKVEWVSINLAIILCIECSGIHRSLGTHISKVRSLTLDITSFTTDIVELLLLVGNRVSNMTWEARLDPSHKPAPQSTREQRLRFITAKYADRAYVEPISPTLSRYSSPDDTLLAAIKKNDIQLVIYALALGANPNAVDKSRETHAIYLALAATDPASPSPAPPTQHGQDTKPVPFPVAELLIQNGSEIPSSRPAFPLSRSAEQYIEQKRGRALGSGAEGLSSNLSNSGLTQEQRLRREKEVRLQKRVSAGGRLAKSPIPER